MRAVVVVLACVTALHAALWALLRDKQQAPDFRGTLPQRFLRAVRGHRPSRRRQHPDREKIRTDLRKLSPLTRAIRLYSSTGGVELVPPIANEFGLKVMVGAWIDKNLDRNEREMQAAIDLAKRNGNVNRHRRRQRNDLSRRTEGRRPDQADPARQAPAVNVPVTTGEIWNIWIEHPELASSVDFIAAHILPYWEGFSEQAGRRSGV